MAVKLRRGAPSDAPALGDFCYRAFKAVADAHRFPHTTFRAPKLGISRRDRLHDRP